MWMLCPDGTNSSANEFVLGSCIAAAPDPARDFTCATGRIASQAYVHTNVHNTMPIHIQFECVEAVCILENVAMVCSSSLLIPITAMLTYRLWVFALWNCLHGWHVATSRVCMGVVFGAVCTCGYVLYHCTAYHYTAIASITSPSSDVTLPSSLIHHYLVWPFVPNWW